MELTFPTFHVDFCDNAGVKIYNGPKSEATLAVEHCGLDNPPAFRSSGQMVSINVSSKIYEVGDKHCSKKYGYAKIGVSHIRIRIGIRKFFDQRIPDTCSVSRLSKYFFYKFLKLFLKFVFQFLTLCYFFFEILNIF